MNQVRQSFNRAASVYDSVGTLQHQVADTLAALITEILPSTIDGRILDAGCGTGFALTPLIARYKAAQFIGLDFAERMLQQLPSDSRALRLNADLQLLPVASSTIQVYLSSLAWQWCNAPLAAREASRVLAPQGHFFIATLTTGTFAELAQCLQASALKPDDHLLPCMAPEATKAAIISAGLEILEAQTITITTWHPDFKALRHSIRGVGANHAPENTTPALSRQTRAQLIKAYDALRTDQGLPLSYDVLMIHARKP